MGSPEEAIAMAEVLKIDDDGFVVTMAQGNEVQAEIRGDSIRSVKRSADDWMACLMAAVRSG